MFRSSFEKSLENATSHLHLEADWPSILHICDEINQKDVTPKTAFAAIKKKMLSPNPHSAYYSLLVLESVVKNCGAPVHDEVFTKENCEMFTIFLEQTPHENVRQKMLELVQTWAYAFRSSDKYQSIKDTMTILKAKGHTFPELKEADAMFTADTAPNWADGKVCHRCRVEFSFTNRKHHCRNCGQVFCGQCTSKQCPLPKYGIEKDVRVCDGCFPQLQRPNLKSALRSADSDLPAEYLNSSLAQQVQTPPRKSEQELKEEEELQLALALSQSEAELKKQQPSQMLSSAYRIQQISPIPEAPPAVPQDQQQDDSNPDLAKYLNRSYWESRKVNESPVASPSAPSPMPTPQPQMIPLTTEEAQIDEFAANMRTQVEIFVNRMKSNSSRGRSIANDSSVQTLFMTLTSMHSQQLSYIKEMDDKRMWYEQLQDKLAQIKDSRAALDVLRQEHAEKLRLMAEEQERQRQIQMAQKLEIMRKKKQEYLQYQRQLALQRIQEQEREMQLRQEQLMAQYRMGQNSFPFLPAAASTGPTSIGSPSHQQLGGPPNTIYNPYSYNPNSPGLVTAGHFNQTNQILTQASPMPGMFTPGLQAPISNPNDMKMMMAPNGNVIPAVMAPSAENAVLNQHQQQTQQMPNMPQLQQQSMSGIAPQQQQQQQPQQQQQQPHPQLAHVMLHQNVLQSPASLPVQIPNAAAVAAQLEAIAAAPAPPKAEIEATAPAPATEPATAELISFD